MSGKSPPATMCFKAPAEYQPVCEEISNMCLEWESWPLDIETDKGKYPAVDAGECVRLAWILAGKGHTLVSPKPVEKPSEAEAVAPEPEVVEPEPEPKPEPKPKKTKKSKKKKKKKKKAKEAPKPPAPEPEKAPPPKAEKPAAKPPKVDGDYEICEKAEGKSGECKTFVDACREAVGFPFTLTTDKKSFEPANLSDCIRLSPILALKGHKLEGTSKGTSKKKGTSKGKPKSSSAAKASNGVPPTPPGKGARMCYEAVGPKKSKLWMDALGVKEVTLTGTCIVGLATYINTIQVDGNGLFEYPIDHCDDGMRPTFSSKLKLDPDVEGAGLQPIDPKQFLTRRCPKKSLKLNTSFKHYYSPKTRAAGEKDLRALCKSEKLEEGFYLIEGKDKSGEPISYWYEVGTNEMPQKVTSGVETCFSFGIQYEFSLITGISQYHYHPTSGYKNFGSEFPSDTDIKSTINTALEDYDTRFGFNPKVFDKRVVTTTGVWTLKPDFDAIRANPGAAEKEFERYDKAREKFFAKIKKNELKHLSRAEQCEMFTGKGSSEFVTVTFEPF